MRKICIAFALAVCIGLSGCDNQDAPRIGVVDLNRLMRDSAPGKAGLQFIESQQKQLQARLDAIQDRIEKNPADEVAMQELQSVYAASQQKIQAEGQSVVTRLFESIQVTLDSFRRNNGYSLLIRAEALDSYDPALDVTNAIMAEVDKLKLDFAPAAPAAQPEGEQGAAPQPSPAEAGKK